LILNFSFAASQRFNQVGLTPAKLSSCHFPLTFYYSHLDYDVIILKLRFNTITETLLMSKKILSTTHTLLLLVSLLLSANSFSHHSDAALDLETVLTITGSVSDYSLRNPHAYVTVAVSGENNSVVEWDIQMASAITMRRLGWDRDSLAIGETVNVGLYPALDGRSYGLLTSITKGNGEALVASPRGISRSRPLVTRADSIAGRWLVDRGRLPADYPGGLDELTLRDLALTETSRVMEAAYSQASDENPELACISKPTPAMIIYTDLYPMEIVINNDETITLRSQYFDQVRTVYMDGREHPSASELFHEGHSVGHWEGETLVIDTTNFAPHRSPYQNGIPSGPQKHIVERFGLIDGGTHMAVSFMLEDPEYIVGNMNYSRELQNVPDADMSPFNCDLDSTRRFLPD